MKQGRIVHRSGLKIKKNNKFLFFSLKDFIFLLVNICVIFIFWWMLKDIVKNLDLYNKEDDLNKKLI